jgi:hypothetical protein
VKLLNGLFSLERKFSRKAMGFAPAQPRLNRSASIPIISTPLIRATHCDSDAIAPQQIRPRRHPITAG